MRSILKKILTILVLALYTLFLTMCDDSTSSNNDDKNDNGNNIDSPTVLTAAGLWLDTFPQMPPVLTSDLQIKFEIKTTPDSTYDIEMQETDTKKHLFIHRGVWYEDSNFVYITGTKCQVLEKEGDTLADNEDLIDTLIAIRKDELDTTTSPDTWNLVANDMAFLIESMDLGVSMALLGNIPIELKRED